MCTGHYALLVDGPDGRELHRASDAAKDQSYVLGVLDADQLAHTLFPLGDTPSKALVRAEAEARGLTVAHKPDSHDICFIPDGDTACHGRSASAPGEIVDRPAGSSAPTPDTISSPWGSGAASTWGCLRAMAGPATCSGSLR